MNCFRFFGFTSLDQVDRLTVKEYTLLCEAQNYKRVDRDRDLALNAWLSFVATAKKQVGKNKQRPVYKTFDSFFNYAKELRRIGGHDDLKKRFEELNERLRR